MKKTFIYLTLILCSWSSTILAQDNSETIAKNAIYANGNASAVFLNSVNLHYNALIKQPEKGFFKRYFLNLGAGYFYNNSGLGKTPTTEGVQGQAGLIGLTGRNKGHFEVGLNVLVNGETKIHGQIKVDDDELYDEKKKKTFLLPEATLGYRYQKGNGILFRIGLGFPQGLYLGLGYSF